MIWYWPYALKPKRALSALAGDAPRRGALIRVGSGFADVHPWPELGDATLDEQLARLARGETTNLTARSLEHAKLDGDARERGVSLFDGLTIPESHWPGPEPPPGFDTVKLKSIDRIPEGVRLRIDFNATLTADGFLRVAERLPRERVDFVEDPCPYDPETWIELRERTGLRLALDRGCEEEGVDVLVIKPAIQEVPVTEKEIVITSYMDHPVGQLFAAYFACHPERSEGPGWQGGTDGAPPPSQVPRYARNDTVRTTPTSFAKLGQPSAGIVTHVLFEPDPFIERMRLDGARLIPPPGTGIGFDDLLEALPWKKLA